MSATERPKISSSKSESPVRRGRVFDGLTCLLRDSIVSGELAPGVALPSEHELAQQHGISRMSVRQALQCLEDESLIVRKPGKGRFVRDLSSDAVHLSNHFVNIGLDVAYDLPWYGARIAAGIKSGHFSDRDCRLVLLNPSEFSRLHNDWVDGAVLAGVSDFEECHRLSQLFYDKGITSVLFNRVSEREKVNYVAVNYRREAELAVSALLRAGHKRIGVVTGRVLPADVCGNPRYRGYCDAMGLSLEEAHKNTFFVTDDNAALAGITQFLAEYKPDALFVTYGFIAPQALRAAVSLNLRLPEDLQVLCFDDISHLAPVFPGSFQYVEMPLERMSREAAEYIAAQAMGRGDGSCLKKLYRARLVDTSELRLS